MQGEDGIVFVRQVDDVNPSSKYIKPQDVVTDVNGVNVRGQRLSFVLKVCIELY